MTPILSLLAYCLLLSLCPLWLNVFRNVKIEPADKGQSELAPNVAVVEGLTHPLSFRMQEWLLDDFDKLNS